MRISYTSVAIDIFHFFHLRLLEQAKNIADYQIYVLDTEKELKLTITRQRIKSILADLGSNK